MRTPYFNHKDLIDILVRDCPKFDAMDIGSIIYTIERKYARKLKQFGEGEYDRQLLF